MKENVGNIKNVIKRVFFVEEKQLDRTIAFRKNLGEREAINLSEKPLIIKDSKNEAGFLSKGEEGYLLDGDTVNSGSFPIKIQEDPNTSLPIKVKPLPIVTLVSPVHPLNKLSPIKVTLSGIITFVSPVQFSNVLLAIDFTLSGIVTLVSPVQPLKTLPPIFVIPSE